MDLFSSSLLVSLKKSLDAGSLQQRVIANNIANLNTPGFKKSEVVFESLLSEALGKKELPILTTDPRHFGAPPELADLKPAVIIDNSTSMRTDGNNVDIDAEMTKLASNGIKYQAVARIIGDKYNGLSRVITGGRSG